MHYLTYDYFILHYLHEEVIYILCPQFCVFPQSQNLLSNNKLTSYVSFVSFDSPSTPDFTGYSCPLANTSSFTPFQS
jgi:hypothetical protein